MERLLTAVLVTISFMILQYTLPAQHDKEQDFTRLKTEGLQQLSNRSGERETSVTLKYSDQIDKPCWPSKKPPAIW